MNNKAMSNIQPTHFKMDDRKWELQQVILWQNFAENI